mmetsp:Transcript_5769/g.11735  ORF Transcript_5769/g.11735 Transcript_5769/m.11735 type:complete len:1040 (+) Transcript_5769:161-3280(+)
MPQSYLSKLRFIFKRRRPKKYPESPSSPRKKHGSSSDRNKNNNNTKMQSSPSRRSRRLLGSRVLDCNASTTASSSLWFGDDSDKENHTTSITAARNNNRNFEFLSPEGHSLMKRPQKPTNAQGGRKLTMTWAELKRLNTSPSGKKSSVPSAPHEQTSEVHHSFEKQTTLASSDANLSPTARSTSSAPKWLGSDMNYSSIARDHLTQVPSAKTISEQFFPTTSEVSSESNSTVGLALSLVNGGGSEAGDEKGGVGMTEEVRAGSSDETRQDESSKDQDQAPKKQQFRGGRARMLYERERDLRRKKHQQVHLKETKSEFDTGDQPSPETLRIIEEVEQAYQTSPIPASYIASPPKEASLPSISLRREKMDSRNKKAASSTKKVMDASTLLAKEGRLKGRQSLIIRSAATNETKPRTDEFKLQHLTVLKTSIESSFEERKLMTADEWLGQQERSCHLEQEALSSPAVSSDHVVKALEREFSGSTLISSRSNSATSITVSSQKSRRQSIVSSRTEIGGAKKPTALAVEREKTQRKQRLSDARSASNKNDGRRNLDKRTARLRFAVSFKSEIMQHRTSFPHLNNGSNHSDKGGSHIQDRGLNGVSIAVRKRPIFDYELDRGDYDIVSIDNSTGTSFDKCIVHNCVMHADMKQMLMKNVSFTATAAFDEYCSDDDIYKHIAEPLVVQSVHGGVATILMYGQTGCGKSHTMSGIENRTATGLFHIINSLYPCESEGGIPSLSIQFIELCGSKECKDLLNPKLVDVKLADDEDGSVRLLNAKSFEVKSAEDLVAKITLAKGRRATEATDKNGVSSRSHAVCQIQIKAGKKRGVLTLIDCAGSERRHDSMYHSSERQKESAEINASLWALKECIRARATNSSRIPYRNSNLTRILRESFERQNARLCVIACVAPNATDTEHTMETLKTVATICGFEDQIKEAKAHVVTPPTLPRKKAAIPVKDWDHDQVVKFLERKKMNHKVKLSNKKYDGKALMKMSLPQMRAQLFVEKDKDLAVKLFNILRKENDRVSKLERSERANLANERKGRV